jgi:hypothetical protein
MYHRRQSTAFYFLLLRVLMYYCWQKLRIYYFRRSASWNHRYIVTEGSDVLLLAIADLLFSVIGNMMRPIGYRWKAQPIIGASCERKIFDDWTRDAAKCISAGVSMSYCRQIPKYYYYWWQVIWYYGYILAKSCVVLLAIVDALLPTVGAMMLSMQYCWRFQRIIAVNRSYIVLLRISDVALLAHCCRRFQCAICRWSLIYCFRIW